MPKKTSLPKKARLASNRPSASARSTASQSTLRRPLQTMSAVVRRALEERGLLAQYRQRPAYQRNDYLSWIGRAKLEETRSRRLEQMLAELAAGDRYMKMAWRPRTPG